MTQIENDNRFWFEIVTASNPEYAEAYSEHVSLCEFAGEAPQSYSAFCEACAIEAQDARFDFLSFNR